MDIRTAKICNVGGRENNQDFVDFVILEKEKMACWVVADGLGGHMGGETASKTAVEAILGAFKRDPACSSEAITRYLETAQQELLRLQQENPRLSRMRTTLVIMVTDSQHFLWGHIGDSRFYHLEDGTIGFQTKDHSVPQSMVAAGDITPDQVRHHEDRNRLLRSMGQPESFKPQVQQEKKRLYDGDVFLLCTDGFWEYVEETEMEMDFAKAEGPKEWLKKMERRLLQRAEGEFDNYTAIAVYFSEPSRPRPPRPVSPPPPPPAKEEEEPGKPPVIPIITVVLAVLALILIFMNRHRLFPPDGQQKPEPPTINSPSDLTGLKRIYLPKSKELYQSLEKALEKAEKNEKIWIGPGYLWLTPGFFEKGLFLEGAGEDRTYIFIIPGKEESVSGMFAKIFQFKELVGNLIKVPLTIRESRIMILSNKIRIVLTFPGMNESKQKRMQKEFDYVINVLKWIKTGFLKVKSTGKEKESLKMERGKNE